MDGCVDSLVRGSCRASLHPPVRRPSVLSPCFYSKKPRVKGRVQKPLRVRRAGPRRPSFRVRHLQPQLLLCVSRSDLCPEASRMVDGEAPSRPYPLPPTAGAALPVVPLTFSTVMSCASSSLNIRDEEGRARLRLRQEPGGAGAPGRRAGRCDRRRREPRQVLGPAPQDRRVRPGGQAGRRAGARRERWRLGAGPEGVVPPAGGRREAAPRRLSHRGGRASLRLSPHC